MYSLEELLDLFHLTYNITMDDLKRAKKQVLMTHPDKSRLPPEYFLFYKKAFDMVVQFYENQNKQNQQVTEETTKYHPINPNDHNKATTKNVTSVINEMSTREFQQKFNRLFEENMSSKPDPTKNEWFSKDDPIYNVSENVNSKNMGQVFEKIKETQSGLIKYKGVENLYVNNGSGTNLYQDMDDSDEYVSCDPFSKLKFDDLRKVHKDQTVFAVSERDFQKVPQYSSVDQFMRERGKQTLTPLEKHESEKMLNIKEQQFKEKIMKHEHASNLRTLQNVEKNKSILSNFLQLKN